MPKTTQEHPKRRGCGGLAEFTVNGGMDEETDTRTWEAPYIDSLWLLRDLMWSTFTGKALAMGWRMKRSTLRWGKPTTWGRT
jgi:hypothetical protein